jgi:chromosome segregation ATPase
MEAVILLAEDRQRLADELFDTRNRYGCGPEQEGPDALQRLEMALAQRDEAIADRSHLSDECDALQDRVEAVIAELRGSENEIAFWRNKEGTTRAGYEAAEAALAALRGQVETMREALRSFDGRAKNYDGGYQDFDLAIHNSITVGDLRRARAALATPEEGTK